MTTEQFTLDCDPLDGTPIGSASALYQSAEEWRATVTLENAIALYRQTFGGERLADKLRHAVARTVAASKLRGGL